MPPRLFFAAAFAVVILFSSSTSSPAQTIKFLGPGQQTGLKYSPKYNIPYRDNGFDSPAERRWKKARKRGASEQVIEEIKVFPGSSDAIGKWIDEGWDAARKSFEKCGGRLQDFASRLSPTTLQGGVTIESTIWYEPLLKSYLAGGYYPDTRSVRVVNIYYGSTGDYRHARLLLIWEIKNHFAALYGLQSEPVAADWPCNAR
jgi:hypothetical protein